MVRNLNLINNSIFQQMPSAFWRDTQYHQHIESRRWHNSHISVYRFQRSVSTRFWDSDYEYEFRFLIIISIQNNMDIHS